MAERLRVAVVPAGAFGTALTFPLAENVGKTVESLHLVFRATENYQAVLKTGENQKHLAGVKISTKVHLTDSLKEGLSGAHVIVFASRMDKLRELAQSVRPFRQPYSSSLFINKGLEEGTNMTASEVVRDVIPDITEDSFAVLSGPNFAHEIAAGLPTLTVIASENIALAYKLQSLFSTNRFFPEISRDRRGVELGGALKNPIAMVVGISAGLGMGENAAAALRNMGLWEMTRLAVAMGAEEKTLIGGLAGQADLDLSSRADGRNYKAGVEIGQGADPRLVLQSERTIEGLHTIGPAVALARRYGVKVPLMQILFEIIYEGRQPKDLINILNRCKLKT